MQIQQVLMENVCDEQKEESLEQIYSTRVRSAGRFKPSFMDLPDVHWLLNFHKGVF